MNSSPTPASPFSGPKSCAGRPAGNTFPGLLPCLPRLAAGLLLAISASASGDVIHWTGGDGTWDTTELAWTPDPALSPPFQTWSNPAFDTAVFSGPAGTVTLGEAISAGSLTFATDGYTITGNTLTLAGIGSVDTGDGTQTLASILAGAATSFTKTGSGTLILTAANTWTGATLVNGGTLAVSGSGASIGVAGASASTLSVGSTADSSLTIENGAVVQNTTATLGGASGTTGSVTVDGAGSAWNITHTSGTTLSIASGGSGSLTVSNGGAVTLARPAVFAPAAGRTADFLVTGASSTFTTTSTLNFGNGAAAGATTATISAGGKVNSSSGNIGASSGLGTANVTITGAGSSWTTTNVVAVDGTGSLSILDGGTMTVGNLFGIGGNTGTTSRVTVGGDSATLNVTSAAIVVGDSGRGTLEINDGGTVNAGFTLRIGNDDAAVGIVNQNGGTVTVTRYIHFFKGTAEYHLLGGTLVVGDAFGAGIVTPSAASYLFELGGGTLQVLGNNRSSLTVYADITLKAGTTSTLSTPGGAGQIMYMEGVIRGPGGLIKTGPGALYLDGINSFTGGLTIAEGIVNPLPGSLGAGSLGFSGNSTLQIDYTDTAFAGNVAIDPGVTGTIEVANGRTLTLSGAITGSGALRKTSSGTLALAGVNDFTGGLTVSGGVLRFSGLASLGSGPLTLSGGELRWDANNTADVTAGGRVLAIGSGGSTFNTNGNDVTLSGDITGTGAFAKSGAGTLTLSGNNTWAGATTTLNAGTLVLASAAALPSTGTLVLNGGTLTSTTARTLGNTVTLSANSTLGGAADLTFNGNLTNSGGNRTLTINNAGLTTFGTINLSENNTGRTLTLAGTGDILVTGAIRNRDGANTTASNLVKSGAGTLTLSGANTWTGSTSVNAGTLLVNGSLASTAVTVADGATLGGSGSIGGLTTIRSGAHLAPGNSPGTLTFTAGLALQSGAILDFELGDDRDLIRISGGILSGPGSGTITLNLADAGGLIAGTWTLFDFSGATLADFDVSGFVFGSTPAGYDYALALSGSALRLTVTAIPEPAAVAALLATATLALAVVRRRKSHLPQARVGA
ncbi:autotransporter [Opitutaceae bacterium TAV5]|nr:autotransporter [Opitutaceae bacterium TAV5]